MMQDVTSDMEPVMVGRKKTGDEAQVGTMWGWKIDPWETSLVEVVVGVWWLTALLAYCVTVLVGAADWFIGQGLEGGIAKISADDDKFGPRAASLL